MVRFIIGVIILLFLLYTVIPYLLTFGFNIGALRYRADSSKIAFTFDDGPHPVYTPMLLDLLKQHDIKATFFVVGSRAEMYPELLLRMKKEGHLIGVHNYVHRSNWLMFPWTVREGIQKTSEIIEKITGLRPTYYRPPWGLLNLGDFFFLRPYNIILWSVMAQDWKSKGGSAKIKRKLLNKIKGGAVILLHDCGETPGADSNAPLNTINALKDILPVMAEKGYTCVKVNEMER
jgi:peptidoglycan/xylan/chitin deacetylase (PgdA/CDA1 family)